VEGAGAWQEALPIMSGFRGQPDELWLVEHMVLSHTSVTGIGTNPPGDG
jgi:hypothetical protein